MNFICPVLVSQSCEFILSLWKYQYSLSLHFVAKCLFNLYAEYILRNTGLEEQAGIKIAGRNINNLRYADDTILVAESEEELKSLLMKVLRIVHSLP